MGGSERILFVDDEKMLAAVGRQALQHLGYDVVSRTSPIEALELFKVKPDRFDLVITDQTMPGMTGDSLARELMRIRPTFLLLSAKDQDPPLPRRAEIKQPPPPLLPALAPVDPPSLLEPPPPPAL
jgi:CheY-like chemotaxis protein